jgi:hypothetical protein
MSLKSLNIIALLLHFILLVLSIYSIKTHPDGFGRIEKTFDIELNPCFSNFPSSSNNPECNNQNRAAPFVINESSSNLPVMNLLALFFLITWIFHCAYALGANTKKFNEKGEIVQDDGFYTKMINNNNNFLRWIEYSITSTLMIIILSRFCGISQKDTLIMIAVANVAIMLQGQITEYALKNNNKSLAWFATFIGWMLLFGIWYVIITKWQKTTSTLKEAGIPIPDWVGSMIYVLGAFFASFGFVQLVQVIFGGDYKKYEYAYIILSFLSKATLGSYLLFGINQSNVYFNSSKPSNSS